MVAHEVELVGSLFVKVPHRKIAEVKFGIIQENWKDNPNKLGYKDVDARWMKKNNVPYQSS